MKLRRRHHLPFDSGLLGIGRAGLVSACFPGGKRFVNCYCKRLCNHRCNRLCNRRHLGRDSIAAIERIGLAGDPFSHIRAEKRGQCSDIFRLAVAANDIVRHLCLGAVGCQESIELWLAAEYRWLPVRIRFFDREGEPSGEQLVSDIRVSAD